MAEQPLLLLDRASVVALGGADFAAAVRDTRDALLLLRAGEAEMPAETSVALGDSLAGGRAYALPAALGGRFQAAGVKWTAHRPEIGDGLPTIASYTIVNDRRVGTPLGIVESGLLTAMRTAAVTALSLDCLAPVVLRTVSVLGAGFQARTHLHMLAALRPELDKVVLWNRTDSRAADIASCQWPFEIEIARSPDAAARGDAVLLCTNAKSPILDAANLSPGRLIVQVGYHEASFDVIECCDHVVADLWGEFRLTSAKSLFQMHRAGRFQRSQLACELADAVAGTWRPRPGSLVYMSSFGLNIFDIALAARLIERARTAGADATHPPSRDQRKTKWPWM
jgi:ornithine cyclodeaminase